MRRKSSRNGPGGHITPRRGALRGLPTSTVWELEIPTIGHKATSPSGRCTWRLLRLQKTQGRSESPARPTLMPPLPPSNVHLCFIHSTVSHEASRPGSRKYDDDLEFPKMLHVDGLTRRESKARGALCAPGLGAQGHLTVPAPFEARRLPA